jgi:rubredoxin
MRSFS